MLNFKKPLTFLMVIFLILPFTILAKSTPSKPLIGIMLNDGGTGGYSTYPWYAIRQNYGKLIAKLGGIPVYVGFDTVETNDYLQILDGILLTGGEFPTPDEVYTTGLKGDIDPQKYPRSAFEIKLIKQAFSQDIPVLGICAGMQDMTAALGGTLIRRIAKEVQTDTNHYVDDREKAQHKINIKKESKLNKILQSTTLNVNSNHQAGVKRIPEAFIETATAEDGVIEGIEAPNKRFFIGVMWHPEFLVNPQEEALFKEFIHAAEIYAGGRQ